MPIFVNPQGVRTTLHQSWTPMMMMMMKTMMISALMARPTSALHLATSAPTVLPSSPISLGENTIGKCEGNIKKDGNIYLCSVINSLPQFHVTMSPIPMPFSHDYIFLVDFCTSNLLCVQPYWKLYSTVYLR